jgi:hypothetical protein
MPRDKSGELLIKSPFKEDDYELIGNDPREVDSGLLQESFSSKTPIKAIRAKCLDCSGGSETEVRKCVAVECPLWPFRMTKNPFHGSFGIDRRKPRDSS